jgi:hypothetical protein
MDVDVNVLEAAEFIVSQAAHVKVLDAGVRACAERIVEAGPAPFALSGWLQTELNPHGTPHSAVVALLRVVTILRRGQRGNVGVDLCGGHSQLLLLGG